MIYDCNLCSEHFDYPMKRIAFELPNKKIDTGWACELCAMEFDADAEPRAFDGFYSSTENGHPKPSTLPAPGNAPLFRDRTQCSN